MSPMEYEQACRYVRDTTDDHPAVAMLAAALEWIQDAQPFILRLADPDAEDVTAIYDIQLGIKPWRSPAPRPLRR